MSVLFSINSTFFAYCTVQFSIISNYFFFVLFSINSTFFAPSMILHCVIQHQHLLVHFFIALCYSASTLYFAASAIFFARCTMKLFFPCARILWEFLNDACNGDAFVITFLMIMIIMVMVILVTIQMIILMIMVFGDSEYPGSSSTWILWEFPKYALDGDSFVIAPCFCPQDLSRKMIKDE